MRRYAYLKEPIKTNKKDSIYKIMLYQTKKDGVYLFMYCQMIRCLIASTMLFYR